LLRQNYQPLTRAEKFRMASEDSLDRGTFVFGGIYAAQGQWASANRSFGQGAVGFGKYFGAAYGDLVIGNCMTEAVFPALLHQDPRYFHRSRERVVKAPIRSRPDLWTHHDSGTTQFNHSEIVGSVAASPQKMRFTKTRSRKLTSVVIGPTGASGGQLSENTYDWLFGLVETQVP
jgi:hypothetical protein